MNKPSATKIWLFEHSPFSSISVRWEYASEDTSRSFVKLAAVHNNAKKEFAIDTMQPPFNTAAPLIKLRIDWNSVAEVADHVSREVAEWKKFEQTHKKDIAEYERLKKKLEAPDD